MVRKPSFRKGRAPGGTVWSMVVLQLVRGGDDCRRRVRWGGGGWGMARGARGAIANPAGGGGASAADPGDSRTGPVNMSRRYGS
ncbi:hypothetical protein GCM10027075_68600 [Streptomyces heilongjiangensis]